MDFNSNCKNELENMIHAQGMETQRLIAHIKHAFDKTNVPYTDEIVEALANAPASAKYHGNYRGGLFHHCLCTAVCLANMSDELNLKWQNDRSPFLVAFYHDLCKTDAYTFTEDGIIHAECEDKGHGDKSVRLVKQIVPDLTEEEELCIRWHMGAFDDKENWKSYGEAVRKYPNVLFTHTADMYATHILENI